MRLFTPVIFLVAILSSCIIHDPFEGFIPFNEEEFDENTSLSFTWFIENRRIKKTPMLPVGCERFSQKFYISTNGMDSNDGSRHAPLFSIQEGISRLSNSSCGLVYITPGVYFEALTIRDMDRLTLFAERPELTQVISKRLISEWEEVEGLNCGRNPCQIFKTHLDIPFANNFHLHYKNKTLTPLDYPARVAMRVNVNSDDLNDEFDLSPSEWNQYPDFTVSKRQTELTDIGRQKLKRHMLYTIATDSSSLRLLNNYLIGRNNHRYDDLSAGFFSFPSELGGSDVYLRVFEEDFYLKRDISRDAGYNLTLRDSSNVVIQNISFLNGRFGIIGTGVLQNIHLEGNNFRNNFRGIYFYKTHADLESISDIKINNNLITNNFTVYHGPDTESGFRNFNLLKASLGDAHGVYLLDVDENIEVSHNFIFNVANGIQNNNEIPGQVTNNIKVHHNLIINTLDDALEPGGFCRHCEYFSNHVRNGSQALRLKIKNVENNGPVFIYKNVFYNKAHYTFERENFFSNQTNIFYHTGTTAPIFFYHNYFTGFRGFIKPTRNSEIGGPNMMFINNIFSTRYNLPNERLGYWPSFLFDLNEAEYDENGEQIPLYSRKNDQPILVNNWFGGSIDSRTFVTRRDGSTRALYEQNYLYNFNRENIFHQESDDFGVDFLDGLHADEDNVLGRTNFCPDRSDFFHELEAIFRSITEISENGIHFVLEVERRGSDYIHFISRDVEYDLPGISNNHQIVGPFARDDNSCRDFSWLLEEI